MVRWQGALSGVPRTKDEGGSSGCFKYYGGENTVSSLRWGLTSGTLKAHPATLNSGSRVLLDMSFLNPIGSSWRDMKIRGCKDISISNRASWRILPTINKEICNIWLKLMSPTLATVKNSTTTPQGQSQWCQPYLNPVSTIAWMFCLSHCIVPRLRSDEKPGNSPIHTQPLWERSAAFSSQVVALWEKGTR